jgi:hypothetical protein
VESYDFALKLKGKRRGGERIEFDSPEVAQHG